MLNTNNKIGNGCIFHRDNCVGNNGNDDECPKIGNNVGLADNNIVSFNAVATKSFSEPGITVAGIPAKNKMDWKVGIDDIE